MRRLRRALRTLSTGLTTAAVTAVAAGAGVVWYDDALRQSALAEFENLRGQTLAATARSGLKVGKIEIFGRTKTSHKQLFAALDVRKGDPIMDFDVALAKERVETLPWVKVAEVERRMPETIRVTLTERKPAALWLEENRWTMVDEEGVVIHDDAEGYGNLMILNGKGAPGHLADLLAFTKADPALAALVVSATWVSDRRWNLELRPTETAPRLTLRLPEENPEAAWARLAALNEEHSLLERGLDMIDLRYADRLILHVAGDDANRAKPEDLPPPIEGQVPGRDA